MGLTAQVFAIDAAMFDEFRIDPRAADAFVRERYAKDGEGTLWLDKSGLGIMEAFGLLSQEARPPASMILGDQESPLPGTELAPLAPGQVSELAAWCGTITDEEFRILAGSNVLDPDVDYLGEFFADLRTFYVTAAERGQATLTYFSG